MLSICRYMRSHFSTPILASAASCFVAVVIWILPTFERVRRTQLRNPSSPTPCRVLQSEIHCLPPSSAAEHSVAPPTPSQAACLSASCLRQTTLLPACAGRTARDTGSSAKRSRCASAHPPRFRGRFHFFLRARPLPRPPSSAPRD